MELYKEILISILKEEKVEIAFPNLSIDPERIVQITSYKALKAIKTILEDDSLTDKQCFSRIEEIIRIFEELGSGCGSRHDFG